jgi:hypothetical protein
VKQRRNLIYAPEAKNERMWHYQVAEVESLIRRKLGPRFYAMCAVDPYLGYHVSTQQKCANLTEAKEGFGAPTGEIYVTTALKTL